mgnify:FL=1
MRTKICLPQLAIILASVFAYVSATLPATAQTTETVGEEIELDLDDDEVALPYVLPKSGPFNPEEIRIENNQAIADWFRSAHADAAAEAFRHWDEDEEIRPVCAVCHAGAGFRSYHGLDGSEPGIPEQPVDVGGVVDCETCHNAGLSEITEISFPSGLMHPVEGVEAACLTCHQGRTAGVTVEGAIGTLPLDEPNGDLRFINPHYATAAASWLGGYGGAGYHYDGRDYAGRFWHARPVSTCVSCHEPHTLEVQTESCSPCHQSGEPEEIRISRHSYAGSGHTSQGNRPGLSVNAQQLMEYLDRYAAEVAGTAMVYDGQSYPYFFADRNGDGLKDIGDDGNVAYNAWTPRLLRAAYNWKLVTADPGAYAHNPAYALELLYDSIEDMATALNENFEDLDLLR